MHSMDSLDNILRRLARSSHWQNLFKMSKECANIQLFENTSNFSGIQNRFLYFLSVYDMLLEELAKHEDEYLSRNVIEDHVRTDAYLVYRNKKNDHLWKKYRRDEKIAEHKSRHPNKHKEGNASLIEVDLRRE